MPSSTGRRVAVPHPATQVPGPVAAPPPRASARLAVGDAADPLEAEADRVADQVMRMAAGGTAPGLTPGTGARVDRACAACEADDELQRKASGDGGMAAPPIVHDVLAAPGKSLAPATRAFMEPRFGHDFSQVRIHDDAHAAASARSVHALAYTHGADIVFDAGRYAPDTATGQRLLAHELAHTIQQGASARGELQRACGRDAIGTPAGCIESSMAVPDRPRYLFDVSCDDFATGNEADLRADAMAYASGETIEIHGLASEEGDLAFNIALSCARALRARDVINDVLTTRGVTGVRIQIFSHGPQTAGARSADRAVAIVRRTTPVPEPEPEPPMTPAPPACGGLFSDGNSETADPDHDLDQVHHAGEMSPDVTLYDSVGGEPGARLDFWAGFSGGTMFESTTDDDTLFDHFTTGNGARLGFGTTTDMARIIGGAPAFTTFATGFEAAIQAHIASTGTLCGFPGDAYIAAHRPAYFHSPLFAWAVMGGYSRIEARVNPTATGVTIDYRIYDHFGAGVTDAWSALLGLSAMYYLQHFHGVAGTAYTPYIWSVEIERTSP